MKVIIDAELGMIYVPLSKMTEGYKKGGLQWSPMGAQGKQCFFLISLKGILKKQKICLK